MGVVLGILLAGGFVGIIAYVGAKQGAAARESKLALIARAIAGTHDSSSATCTRNGVVVRYRFTSRGIGSHSESWTEVDAELPSRYPLAMRVTRGNPHGRGDVVDVEVGDQAFDDAFLIEAAPSDVVRKLLDVAARGFLAGYAAAELTTETTGGRILRFALPGWLESPSEAVAIVDGVSRIASRVRDAYAAADATVPTRDDGSPYRPHVDDQPLRDVTAERDRELAKLATLESERAASARHAETFIVIFAVVALVVVIALARACGVEYRGE